MSTSVGSVGSVGISRVNPRERIETRHVFCFDHPVRWVSPGLIPGSGLKPVGEVDMSTSVGVSPGLIPGSGLKQEQFLKLLSAIEVSPGLIPGSGLKPNIFRG